MESLVCSRKTRNGWWKALPVGLLLLLPLHRAGAQALDTFDVGSGTPADNNTEPLNNYQPNIYATNFLNDTSSTFSWNLGSSGTWLNNLYQGWYYTQNFTNSGEMDSSTGFRFDSQIPNMPGHTEAATFYNAGNLYCGTTLFISTGINPILLTLFSSGFNSYFGYGGAYVLATNIYDSGTIDVGMNGLAWFIGDNIVFNRGSVSLQNFSQSLTGGSGFNLTATGAADYSTNQWSPAGALGQFSAYGPLNKTPFELYLFNSVPYFDLTPDSTGTNVTVRMIFLQDNSVNVTTNVYIGANGGQFKGLGTVEWVGTVTDPATGQALTRYLYLNDDYVGGSATNILNYGDPGTGVPGNYTIYASDTPLALGTPAASGLFSQFGSGNITNNIYSYFNAQFMPSTVSPGGLGLTNLPGRVQISASKNLSLSLTSLSGMNYLQINSTNEFDTDGQSSFGSPYSDFYLGHTNGTFVAANLIQSSLPLWSGSLQAWSTRWTNTVAGTNYDFRVMLVASRLNPLTPSSVQDFVLYSSNNVVISDTLNITRTFSLNCTNLLLTTNGVGNGFASPDGELNLDSSAISWAASVPRLRCLTNNGTISTMNAATYGSAALPYIALVNSGNISNSGGSIVYAGDFENYGAISAGTGQFSVKSLTAAMTNGIITAAGTFSAAANSMVIAGTTIAAGKSLTLIATNQLTDTGVTNGNLWELGYNYSGYGSWTGLALPVKPAYGDLLGTTIIDVAVTNALINNVWAGEDRGAVNAGFSNNVAIGQLILDAQGMAPRTQYSFSGPPGASNNALYVDDLILMDQATNIDGNGNVSALVTNANFHIYYAQAMLNGVSVAEKLNHKNSDLLRWVPTYAGYYSSTNLVYPPGVTNTVNAALAQSPDIDSDGDGNPNSTDPTPFLVPALVNFTETLTNLPPLSVRLQWLTVAGGTNEVDFKTNLVSPDWMALTNFVSPMPYPSPPGYVRIFDPLTNAPHYYRVSVQPDLLRGMPNP
jgi:hypothetical protein